MGRTSLRITLVTVCAIVWLFAQTGMLSQASGPLPVSAGTIADEQAVAHNYELPYGENLFAPSNAAMVSGGFINQEEFIPAARCAGCHAEAHAQWSESAHRNSFREPFYQTNVKHLIRDRKIAVTRHCESCHNPAALFSGVLSEKATFARPFDEEGVTCSVCHSIVSTNTTGIGSYVIDKPALLETADGARLADVTDREILEDVPSHRRAMLNIKRFRYSEALTDLDVLSREYPRDRQVWTQLGSLYLLQYRDNVSTTRVRGWGVRQSITTNPFI